MGNDPVNNIDPSGGWAATGIFYGLSQGGIMATTTLGGAIIGGAIDIATGGDGLNGLMIGAGIGLASNFASAFNWRGAVNVLGKAAPSILEGANQFASFAKNGSPNWGSKTGALVHQQANRIGILRNSGFFHKVTNEEKSKIKALNVATEFADSDRFQNGASSFRHAMRNKGQSIEEAKYKADQIVRYYLNKGKALKKSGNLYWAYFFFGIGLHALQDATSPSHAGFQEWGDNVSMPEKIRHVNAELYYPGKNSNLQKITNQYLDWFENSNEPLPKGNLFDNIKFDDTYHTNES